jgi:trimeric autotransporter adhesin
MVLCLFGCASVASPTNVRDAEVSDEVILYVDPGSAQSDDANLGSASEPLATIAEGLHRAYAARERGTSTRIRLKPGVYRETLVESSPGGGPLIVIEALSPGEVIISGADVFTNWTCSGGVCSHEWNYAWGADPDPWGQGVGELARRREMVIIDGANLDQVLSRTALFPGSFYVDETQGRLHVMPTNQSTLDGSLVEVAVRPFLMRLQGLNDLVIKGIRFQHAASPFRRSAVEVVDQHNVLIEDSEFVWNGQNGVSLKAHDVTLRRSTMSHNGSSGVSAFKLADALFEDTEASYNNWRGFRAGYIGWEVGQKFAGAHRVVLRRHTGSHNLTRGLWFDWDATDVVVEDSVFCDNHTNGMFIEAVQGPITLNNNLFCRNPLSGLQTSATNRFTLTNNAFDNNGRSAINISGDFNRVVTDWETGEQHTLNNSNWQWRDNLMRGATGARLITTSFTTSQWNDLMTTSHLDFNSYVHDVHQAFQIPGGLTVDFTTWKSNTGHDERSSFSTVVASQ